MDLAFRDWTPQPLPSKEARMRTGPIGTLAIVWLLVMVVVGIAVASKPQPMLWGYVEGEMRVAGDYPKVGEIFEVVYVVKVSETADWRVRENTLKYDYAAVIRCVPPEAAEIVGQDKFFFSGLKIGETKEFRTRCRILKPATFVEISSNLDRVIEGRLYGNVASFTEIFLFLTDPATGQYGTKGEWLKKATNVFWKYNNIEPQWLSKPDQEWEAGNRKIAEEMRRFEPALTDSEALCLHRDTYLVLIRGIGDPNASDSSRAVHLLNAGWLKTQRAGAAEHDKWLSDFMGKNKGRWGGDADSNFFRDSNPDSSGSNRGDSSSLEEPPTTTFVGQWLYQDHLYNKEQGLLWAYETKPVKYAEVGIRAYWTEPGPGHGTVFVGWGTTDIHGNFFIQTNLIPSEATQVHAYPVLYAWGPVRVDEMVTVANPSP